MKKLGARKRKVHLVGGPFNKGVMYLSGCETMVFRVSGAAGKYVAETPLSPTAEWRNV